MFCVKGNQVFCCLILICAVNFVAGDDHAEILYKTDYCDYKCNKAPYMTNICLRKRRCGPVNDTCEDIGGTVEFRTEALDVINWFRNRMASGDQVFRDYYSRSAPRMNALSYDMELEYIAQCFTNLCKNAVEKCLASKRFPYALGFLVKSKYTISKALDNILRDISNHLATRNIILSFNSSFDYIKQVGQLNAMVFAVTLFDYIKYVGCGVSKYRDNMDNLYYCIYGLTKNPQDETVYESSLQRVDAASKCKTRNRQFKYLCGDIEPIPTGPSWTKIQLIGLTNDHLELGINPASNSQSIHFIHYRVRLLVICLGLVFHVIIIS